MSLKRTGLYPDDFNAQTGRSSGFCNDIKSPGPNRLTLKWYFDLFFLLLLILILHPFLIHGMMCLLDSAKWWASLQQNSYKEPMINYRGGQSLDNQLCSAPVHNQFHACSHPLSGTWPVSQGPGVNLHMWGSAENCLGILLVAMVS